MDKYEIIFYNSINEKESYIAQLNKLGQTYTSEGGVVLYGLGNTNNLAKMLEVNLDNTITLNRINNNDLYGLIIAIVTPTDGSASHGIMWITVDSKYVLDEVDQNTNKIINFINLEIKHSSVCTGIKTIDSRWLPNSVKAAPDWLATSYEQSGYIRNKICEILSFNNVNDIYLQDQSIVFSQVFSDLFVSDGILIKNFGEINTLNKYACKINTEAEIVSFRQFDV